MGKTRILSRKDKDFYGGVLAALAVVALHDNSVIYDEILGMGDVDTLIAVALAEDDAEWAGLVKYGYVKTESE